MPDLFTSLVSISPTGGALRGAVRVPGVSPDVKAGLGAGSNGGRALMPSGPSPAQGHVFNANAAAGWRFNEVSAAANAVDLGGVYHLTQIGSPPVVAGKIGNARSLDGATQFFQRAGDLDFGNVLNGDFSVEAWIYTPTGSPGGKIFVYNGLDFTANYLDLPLVDFFVNADGTIGWKNWRDLGLFDEFYHPGVPPVYDTWRHVALTRKNPGGYFLYSIYVDGQPYVNQPEVYMPIPNDPIPGNSHFITVGAYTAPTGLGNGLDLFTGAIDDTRVSRVWRAPDEIRTSYVLGSGG